MWSHYSEELIVFIFGLFLNSCLMVDGSIGWWLRVVVMLVLPQPRPPPGDARAGGQYARDISKRKMCAATQGGSATSRDIISLAADHKYINTHIYTFK